MARNKKNRALKKLNGRYRSRLLILIVLKKIKLSGMQDRIKITPNLNEASKQALRQEADFYLQSSHEEGLLLSYIETAVLVPRHGCNRCNQR